MAYNRLLQHFTSSQDLTKIWASSQNYIVNDLVVYTPSNKIYRCLIAHTSSGSFFTDLAAGDWVEVSASAAGLKNYITYGDFENNDANTGWSLSHSTLDSTTKLPNQSDSFWTAAAGTLSKSIVSSGQLAGSYSLSLASSAATTAGDMLITSPLTLDLEAKSSVQTFSFFYKVASGATNGNFSGTSSNSVGVAIYVVDGTLAGTWIQPAGVFNLVQSSGVGKASGTFQVPSDAALIRLAVYFPNATTGAITLYLDDFVLGPQVTPYDSSIVIAAKYSGGSTAYGANAILQFNTKVYDSCNSVTTGAAWKFTAPTSGYYRLEISTIRTSATTFSVVLYVDGVSNQYILTVLNNFAYESGGTTVYLKAGQYIDLRTDNASTIEIGNVSIERVMGLPSVDTSSVVAARYHLNGPQTIPTGSSTILNYESKIFDTHGAVTTGVSWKFTAPISGIYRVSTIINITETTYGAGNQFNADIFKNGVYAYSICPIRRYAPVSTNNADNGTVLIQLNAGDYIDVRQFQNTAGNLTVNNSGSQTAIDIERLSGPSAIAATETVAMRANKTSGSHTLSGSWQDVASWDSPSAQDTHGIFNLTTGVATIPVSGTYLIATTVGFLTNGTGVRAVKVLKNGNDTGIGGAIGATAGGAAACSHSILIKCVAGDLIKAQAIQSSGGSLAYVATDGGSSISIVRVGN